MYLLRKFPVKPGDVRYIGERGDIKEEKIKTITEELIYWRKANAIHNWFITNSREAMGNCGQLLVSRNQLIKLLQITSYLLELSKENQQLFISESERLLPTVDGFFFGSTSYDEIYYINLEYTQKQLQYVLEDNKNTSVFYYSANW